MMYALAEKVLEGDERFQVFAWSELHKRTFMRGPAPWSRPHDSFPRPCEGRDVDEARRWLREHHGHVPWDRVSLDEVVDAVAMGRPWHPLREYLDGLSWDGVPRVDTWLTRFLGAEREANTALMGSRWLIGAVARAFEPGVWADVLVLEGPQGIGKSSTVAVLAGPWFSDEYVTKAMDDPAGLHGAWIWEIGHLDDGRHEELRSFLSRRIDRYRPKYSRRWIEERRTTVFVATTNYPMPDLGRQFGRVKVSKAADREEVKATRDQLWAEAVARYRGGEPWHLWP